MAVGSTTSTSIVTNAALCTLTASASVLERDVVLQLVLHLASDRQVKQRIVTSTASASATASATAAKKGTVPKNNSNNKDVLTLQQHVETSSSSSGDTTGIVLTHRASILRALAGPFLHYALDFILLGGHGAASQNAGSQKSVLAMSSLASWMTVAHGVDKYASTNNNNDDDYQTNLFQQLEKHLETRAFLIPSSQATLADMDLCVAILRLVNNNANDNSATNAWDFTTTPNLVRWATTVHAQMTNLGAKQLPPLVTAKTRTTTMITMPIFFYGTEQESFPSLTPPTKASGGKGQKQQQQQPSATTVTTARPAAAAAAAGGLTEEEKKAAADKRAAKKAASKKTPAAAPTATTTPETAVDITALDIRIGKILKAWHHPDSDKLFCEEVDVGEEKPRMIASGLRAFYQTDDLVDRYVLVLCNLKSRNLAGFPSHGMVLCASDASHEKVEFVGPNTTTTTTTTATPIPGERILFGTLTGDPEPENKVAKKKIVEKVLPNLRTNANGIVVYTTSNNNGEDHVAHTTTIPQGNIAAINSMPSAHVG